MTEPEPAMVLRPTLDAVVALWRQGLAAGDPAPLVTVGSVAAEWLRAELPGVVGERGVALAAGLPAGVRLRISRDLDPGAIVLAAAAPALPEPTPPAAKLPPFRWQDVLVAMPPDPPPADPTWRMPHPLGPDPLARQAQKESPAPANDAGLAEPSPTPSAPT